MESGGRWLAILLAGLALAALLLLGLQAQQVQALRDARLSIALHDIQERLEADLALGFDLHDSARAQSLLEDVLANDGTLLAAEIFDARGVSLFNTDRGSIGERVPQAWLEAITLQVTADARAHRPWRAAAGSDLTLGAPLRGPFGEVAGHASLT
jgi:SAM-dependent MidA family methyltransferase